MATSQGKEFRYGYQVIHHWDLEPRLLYRQAVVEVQGVQVQVPEDLQVGYVMGVGDELSSGIAQLGVEVELLDGNALALADLSRYHALLIGTRAYAVRPDLKTHHHRLLEYVRNGGNLVVLYQTPEFDPGRWAPYPAELPPDAQEVSEEDSPVRLLALDHPILNWPNRIRPEDFDGWVEQRGSKFFARWDPAYLPVLETQDRNQEPQRGGCLVASYGKGFYTYCAYAFHRQLPFGVPGAFRLLANQLSLSRAPGEGNAPLRHDP